MRQLPCTIVLGLALLTSCSKSPTNAIDGGHDGGGDAGSTGSSFAITDLPLGSGGLGPNDFLAAAVSSDGRVGIAYYWDLDQQSASPSGGPTPPGPTPP